MLKFLRIISRILIIVILFFIVVVPICIYILLQISSVQNFAINKLNTSLSEKIKSNVKIEKISFQIPSGIKLTDVYIEDKNGDTLIYSKELAMDIDLLNLLNKKIIITELIIDNTNVNLYRKSGESDFNYTFILNSFDNNKSGSPSPWKFEIKKLNVKSTKFNYEDIPNGITFNSKVKSIEVDFKNFELDKLHLIIKDINADKLQLALNFSNAEIQPEKKGNWKIEINNTSLNESSVIYNNYKLKSASKGFDLNQLNISEIEASIKDVRIEDTISLQIDKFSGKDISGFALNKLEGKLTITSEELLIDILKLKTPNSNIDDPISLKIPIGDKSIINNISAEAKWSEETIAFSDLNYFIPRLDTIALLKDKRATISGQLSGQLNNFSLNKLRLKLDENNFINGDFAARGLPDITKTHLNFDIKQVKLDSTTLTYLTKFNDSLVNIKELGNIAVQGKIKGKTTNASIDLNIKTANGDIQTIGTLKTDNNFNIKSFTGDAYISSFDIGKVFPGLDQFGKISLRTSIDKYDNNLQKIDANISDLKFKNYTYHNIKIKGNLKDDILIMNGDIKDENIISSMNIRADLKNKSYKAEGEIKKIDLKVLHFIENPVNISTKFNADIKGKKIDSIEGIVELSDIHLSDEKQKYNLDSLTFHSTIDNKIHQITIKSNSLEASLKGKFKPSEIPSIYKYISNQYLPHESTLSTKDTLQSEYIDFLVKTGDISELASFLIPNIQVIDSVKGEGSFNKINKTLSLNLTAADIKISNIEFHNSYLTANSKGDSIEFHTGAEFIEHGNNIHIDKPEISGLLLNDSIKFNLKLYEQSAPTRLNLDGILVRDTDKNNLNFPFVQIFIKGKEWKLNPDNKIVFGKDYFKASELELSEMEQKIIINTDSLQTENILKATLAKVQLNDLAEISGLSKYNTKGIINGNITIKEIFSTPTINSSLKIDSFYLSNQELGLLSLNATKKANQEFVDIKINLECDSGSASIAGKYYLDKDNKIDFKATISKLNLQAFESLSKDLLFKLRGNVSGKLNITGNTTNPSVIGDLKFIERNEIGLNLTKTIYRINNEKIIFKEHAIVFDHLKVIDSLNNEAEINGHIYHQGFKDFRFDLNFDTDKFELVKSKSINHNEQFYGSLLAKMHIDMFGPMKDLIINFDATTLKGTNFTFSLVQAQANVENPFYIRFHPVELTGYSDSSEIEGTFPDTTDTKKDLLKFSISGRIKLTKESKLNMIVDPTNGDKVSVLGEGELSLNFDSFNNIIMEGTYVIDSGKYSFSFEKLIQRDFKIQKGSTITWKGKPENATMNITGIYHTKASRYLLVAGQTEFMTQEQVDAARRRLPVDVYLYFDGPILTPEISFDIKIPEGGDPLNGNLVVQEINQIKNNPSELNKQVFSLIFANRFAEREGFLSNTGMSPSVMALNQVNQSVTKVLTNTLNNYGSNFLGLDINFNVESLDRSYGSLAQNAQVKVTKDISSRLSLSAGGNININSNYSSGQFAGDYSVYYRINKDGNINLRFFSTSFQNIYSSSIYTNQGFSLNFQRNFSRWKYLFANSNNNKNEN